MFFLMFAVWLILSQRVTPEICLVGLPLCAAVYWLCCRYMSFSVRKDLLMVRRFGLAVAYLFVLTAEIIKANFGVMKLILSARRPNPALVWFDLPFHSPLLAVVLANSITLTPGTITVSLDGSRYCVHCLDAAFAAGMTDNALVRHLRRIDAL